MVISFNQPNRENENVNDYGHFLLSSENASVCIARTTITVDGTTFTPNLRHQADNAGSCAETPVMGRLRDGCFCYLSW
jgi:hypothetical protein